MKPKKRQEILFSDAVVNRILDDFKKWNDKIWENSRKEQDIS